VRAVVFGLLLTVALVIPAAVFGGGGVTVKLSPRGGSAVHGVAVFRGVGGGTNVALRVSGLRAGSRATAFLRSGTCARRGVRFALLPVLRANGRGHASATGSALSRRRGKLPFTRVTARAYVLTVQRGAKVLACGRSPKPAVKAKPGGGGSDAVCSPSPCVNPGAWGRLYHVTVPDSDGADAVRVDRTFSTFEPGNLTGTAPLLVDLSGTTSAFFQVATSYRMRAILLPNSYHGGQYAVPTTSAAVRPNPNAYGPADCGSGRASQCDDIPWLKAAINAVLCKGAPPCLNVDPKKVYVLGGSKGGNFTEGAICDSRTSSYFHAAAVVSAMMVSRSYKNDQLVPPNCPALLGTSNGYGGAAGLAPNTNISVAWLFGTNDNSVCVPGAGARNYDCLETGYTDVKGRWWFGVDQLAGDANPPAPGTSRGSLRGIGHALQCDSRPTTDVTSGVMRTRTYTGRANRRRAIETVKVGCGTTFCHSFPQMDTVSGVNAEDTVVRFFVDYGG